MSSGGAFGRIPIARQLGIRVARAFFSSQDPAMPQQDEDVFLIIFDDQIICESFSRFVDLESYLNNEGKFFARGGTDFIPALKKMSQHITERRIQNANAYFITDGQCSENHEQIKVIR